MVIVDMGDAFKVYLAGSLFRWHDLMGNAALAESIEKLSGARYQPVLPQSVESSQLRGSEIRDLDFELLFSSDLLLVQFDGSELDSGSAVEFCFAKAADIPAVILRTDFRNFGDSPNGDPWNLMCSAYPRTEKVLVNAMDLYFKNALDIKSGTEQLALQVIDALDKVCVRPAWLKRESAVAHWKNLVCSISGTLPERLTDLRLQELLERKVKKQLL